MHQPTFIRTSIMVLLLVLPITYAASDPDALVIDTFSWCLKKGLPCGWEKWKETKGVSLANDSTGCFVTLTSADDVEGIGKKISFCPEKYPWVRWRWRVHTLPYGAREDIKKKNDSAAGFFIAFKGMFPFGHVLKYVWSSSLPAGSMQKSPHNGNVMIFVLQSGPSLLDTWVSEKRNILEDYRTAFGSDPPDIQGVALQTDSDNTESSACASYADFSASRNQ